MDAVPQTGKGLLVESLRAAMLTAVVSFVGYFVAVLTCPILDILIGVQKASRAAPWVWAGTTSVGLLALVWKATRQNK